MGDLSDSFEQREGDARSFGPQRLPQKVKVQRYVAGKVTEFAREADSDSDEDERRDSRGHRDDKDRNRDRRDDRDRDRDRRHRHDDDRRRDRRDNREDKGGRVVEEPEILKKEEVSDEEEARMEERRERARLRRMDLEQQQTKEDEDAASDEEDFERRREELRMRTLKREQDLLKAKLEDEVEEEETSEEEESYAEEATEEEDEGETTGDAVNSDSEEDRDDEDGQEEAEEDTKIPQFILVVLGFDWNMLWVNQKLRDHQIPFRITSTIDPAVLPEDNVLVFSSAMRNHRENMDRFGWRYIILTDVDSVYVESLPIPGQIKAILTYVRGGDRAEALRRANLQKNAWNVLKGMKYVKPLEEALAMSFDFERFKVLQDSASAYFGMQPIGQFVYLLMDPRMKTGVEWTFSEFLDAVFYVGKGTDSRPLAHLSEVRSKMERKIAMDSKKESKIHEIWTSFTGVIVYELFHNNSDEDCHSREAAMIRTIVKKNVTNIQHGTFYGPVDDWAIEDQCLYGVGLWLKAFRAVSAVDPKHVFAHMVPLQDPKKTT